MSGDDSERVRVSTYVPAHQKETWQADAEALDMSQSEFLRTMVQIGRRDFDVPSLVANGGPPSDVDDDGAEPGGRADGSVDRTDPGPGPGTDTDGTGGPGGTDGADPAGTGVEARVVDVLSEDGILDWDELLSELTADIEEDLDDALASLQADNRVRYSGRHGGYTLVEAEG